MIHTFTLTYQINATEYWAFKEDAHTKSYRTRSYKLENRLLEDYGLVLYGCQNRVPNRPDYFCYDMFVNPAKLLGRKSVTDIYTPDLFAAFCERFNEAIKAYGVSLPPVEEWKAKRVDYTKDIRTEHVKLYIKLFQKSNLKKYTFYTNKQNNKVRFRPGSMYCGLRSYKINFYDKQDEMLNTNKKILRNNENRPLYTDEELEQATNVLRLEVQCHKHKLIAIKNKYGLRDRNIIPFLLREDIAAAELKYYVQHILGTAAYYKKPSAITKILKSRYSKATKERMITFINEVSKPYSSVDKVLQDFEDYQDLLHRFEELGVNPVTIDKNTPNINIKIQSICELI